MDGTILTRRRRAATTLALLGAGLGLMAAGPGSAFAGTLSHDGTPS